MTEVETMRGDEDAERIESPTTAEFSDYVRERRPVILRGAMEDWPAPRLF